MKSAADELCARIRTVHAWGVDPEPLATAVRHAIETRDARIAELELRLTQPIAYRRELEFETLTRERDAAMAAGRDVDGLTAEDWAMHWREKCAAVEKERDSAREAHAEVLREANRLRTFVDELTRGRDAIVEASSVGLGIVTRERDEARAQLATARGRSLMCGATCLDANGAVRRCSLPPHEGTRHEAIISPGQYLVWDEK